MSRAPYRAGPLPGPYRTPAPAPMSRAPYPSPSPAPVPGPAVQDSSSSSSEEDETETEFSYNHVGTTPAPAPMPALAPAQAPIPAFANPQPQPERPSTSSVTSGDDIWEESETEVWAAEHETPVVPTPAPVRAPMPAPVPPTAPPISSATPIANPQPPPERPSVSSHTSGASAAVSGANPQPPPYRESVSSNTSSGYGGDETETSVSAQHESQVMPAPFRSTPPAPPAPPAPAVSTAHSQAPIERQSVSSHTSANYIGDIDQTKEENYTTNGEDSQIRVITTNHHLDSNTNRGNKEQETPQNQNLKAAADLIHTLDQAYVSANKATATTALDAEDARKTARTAAEIARRYTTGSHPREGSDLTTTFDRQSPASAYHKGKAFFAAGPPAVETNHETNNDEAIVAAAIVATTPRESNASTTTPNHNPIYFPTASPSSRLVHSRAEDALALSLELERAKQSLETERMVHDDTKNLLAEERSRTAQLQQKLQRLEGSMETQRETLGRSGDALEEELQQARLRMEAAEEDAQLALDFAKESEEGREQLERMLQEAMEEIAALRGEAPRPSTTEEEDEGYDHGQPLETQHKSILKHDDEDDSEKGNRSVHFSDPISFSNSPIGDSFILEEQETKGEPEQSQQQLSQQNDSFEMVSASSQVLATPKNGSSTPRSLVVAGRRLLQQSTGKDDATNKTYSFEYTPEKSAERRQRLRETLKDLDSAVVIPTPLTVATSPRPQNLQFSTNVLELCRTTTEVLLASGSQLELDGHWWREKKEEGNEPVELDSLARQYCQSVEVKISRQKNEISELESLCSFLEESVAR